MKSTIPFIIVAVVTATLAFAAMNYARGSETAPAQSSVECCDPQTAATSAK